MSTTTLPQYPNMPPRTVLVYIRHVVGRCPICSAPILDAGWTDDPNGWVHSHPIFYHGYNLRQLHTIGYGVCTMALSPTPLWLLE